MDEVHQLFEMISQLSDRVLNLELQVSILSVQLEDHRKADEPPLPEVPDGYDQGLD